MEPCCRYPPNLALHGVPSSQIVDELHVATEDVWEAVTSVAGKRPESLTLAIRRRPARPIQSCGSWWSSTAAAMTRRST
jgi:hypothetical protein